MTEPLVSILIPAYNAAHFIRQTLESAVSQTWRRKEIIVVNDGSTDGTADLVTQFISKDLKLITTENQGLSGAVNTAYKACQGDYIQELDADDVLSPDKIERQLKAVVGEHSNLTLPSSPWGYFYYRTSRAQFIPNSLWQNLSPVEWLLRKLSENLHMQNATWLVSRELAEKAGPWDTQLNYDQDGEYFARVLAVSEGTCFVPEGRVYYRASGSNRISFIGSSNLKKNSLLRSMKLHVQYIRSLEDSDRVRKACLTYLQNWYENFYPDRPDIVAELSKLAGELGGFLEEPALRWKYGWIKPVFGIRAAKWAQRVLPEQKLAILKRWDKAMFELETRQITR